ncbi:MAG: hypothetical protein WBG30_05605, partial [Psychrilyobacter sp.]|uniref:hypothetical protein n=1 Tax=Psychrilyobacter sp. TaxID=2586924 RepID=UPI003C73C90C
MDALLKMSASTDLKENMTNLVKKYLKFFNKSDDGSDKQNGILLLEIDDIDLSTKYAYEMVEQIRKYLIIPNTVILMAVKMQQLSHILERNTRKEFEDLLKESHMNDEEPKNMAEKYLMKLIPLERRLFLPNFDNINLGMMMEVKTEKNSIEKMIRTNIYNKTGMMFFNTTTQVSYIVPKNLREIVNLVSRLDKMTTPKKDSLNRKEMKTKNFHEFREYFLNHWVEENLTDNQKEIIKEIYTRDVEEKNKFIVRILDEIYREKFLEKEHLDGRTNEYREIGEYFNIVNFLNNPENISIGDILAILDIINKGMKRDIDKKFIFAIKTIYSFLLYFYTNEIEEKRNIETNVKEYKKLINGYVRNVTYHKVLSKNQIKIINKSEYVADEDVKKWLDHFIIWRGLKEYNSNEGRYRISIRKYNVNSSQEILAQKFEFDYFGFLFNDVEESIKNRLYIGNIEMLEKISKFRFTEEEIPFIENVIKFIGNLVIYINNQVEELIEFKTDEIYG